MAQPPKNIGVFFFVLFLLSCMFGVILLLVKIKFGKASKIAYNICHAVISCILLVNLLLYNYVSSYSGQNLTMTTTMTCVYGYQELFSRHPQVPDPSRIVPSPGLPKATLVLKIPKFGIISVAVKAFSLRTLHSQYLLLRVQGFL